MSANNKPPSSDSEAQGLEPPPAAVVVYATFPSRAAALACGRKMVEQGVAGCVNVLPQMTSIYVWKGEIETADEAVLIAKLAAEGAAAAVDFVVAHHTYDMPAVLVLPVTGGSTEYLDWIRRGTAAAEVADQ